MNEQLEAMLSQIIDKLDTISNNTAKRVKRNQQINPNTSFFNLEEIYKFYPRKEGKTAGMRILARDIKDRKDYEALKVAVENYTCLCRKNKTERKFIKLFGTFAGCWRDYIQPLDPESALYEEKPTEVETPTKFLI